MKRWKELEESYRPWQDPPENRKGEKRKYRYWHVRLEKGDRRITTRSSYEAIMTVIEEYDERKRNSPTVEGLYREWLCAKLEREEISRSTADRYDRDFDRFFDKIRGEKAEAFDAYALERFALGAIHEHGLTRKGYARLRTILFAVFRLAKKKGAVSFDVEEAARGFDISKNAFAKSERKGGAFTDEEIARLDAEIRRDPGIVSLGIALDLRLGGRIGELSALKWEDVDWERGAVRVCRTESIYRDPGTGKWAYEPREGAKTDAGVRDVVLPGSAMRILEEIKGLNPDGEFVFELDGKRARTYMFRYRLKALCEKAGVDYQPTHALRRSCASMMVDGGAPQGFVAGQLGHTDFKTTMGYYYKDRTTDEEKRRTVDRVFGE